MSLGVSSRLKFPKKQELAKSVSQSTILANLRHVGQLNTVENIMQAVEQLSTLLASGMFDEMTDNIQNICQHVKAYGDYLETLYQDQLNRSFVVFRNSSQDERLDYASRLHLLKLIELRANQWKETDFMAQYYKKKGSHEVEMSSLTDILVEQLSVSPPLLAPGEIIRPSGKFSKPTRIPGKNYCKDEVVIRNADSGKVMGIKGRRVHMIEELSETVISFQRVNPGAKERLVQITGSNEDSINNAKQLIEDTIRRNASPVREPGISCGPLTGSSSSLNSSASEDNIPPYAAGSRTLLHSLSAGDASLLEYKYSINVNGHIVRITGHDLEFVRSCKIVLDEYFAGKLFVNGNTFNSSDSVSEPPLTPPESAGHPSPIVMNGQNEHVVTPQLRRPRLSAEEILLGKTSPDRMTPEPPKNLRYSLEFLAQLALSPYCLSIPDDWDKILNDFPVIVRKAMQVFDTKEYLAHRKTVDMENIISSADDADSNLEAA